MIKKNQGSSYQKIYDVLGTSSLPAESVVESASKWGSRFKVMARPLLGVGLAIDSAELVEAYKEADNDKMARSAVDVGVLVAGYGLGLPGFLFSTCYAITEYENPDLVKEMSASIHSFAQRENRASAPVFFY